VVELPAKGSVIFPIELAAKHLANAPEGSLLARCDRRATP
jgi:hypothetical protein